jgi:hypothetical protein
MQARETVHSERLPQERSQERTEADNAGFTPRLWMVMILCVIPFFMMAAHWFEALERLGSVWRFLAAPLLMTTTLAYVACCFVLKKRNL